MRGRLSSVSEEVYPGAPLSRLEGASHKGSDEED